MKFQRGDVVTTIGEIVWPVPSRHYIVESYYGIDHVVCTATDNGDFHYWNEYNLELVTSIFREVFRKRI